MPPQMPQAMPPEARQIISALPNSHGLPPLKNDLQIRLLHFDSHDLNLNSTASSQGACEETQLIMTVEQLSEKSDYVMLLDDEKGVARPLADERKVLTIRGERVEVNGYLATSGKLLVGPLADQLLELRGRGWNSFWVKSLCINLKNERECAMLHKLKEAISCQAKLHFQQTNQGLRAINTACSGETFGAGSVRMHARIGSKIITLRGPMRNFLTPEQAFKWSEVPRDFDFNYHKLKEESSDLSVYKWYLPIVKTDSIGELCGNCSHIDFVRLLGSTEPTNGTVHLGPLQTIIQRQDCQFCRLVVRTLCIAQEVSGSEDLDTGTEAQRVSYWIDTRRPQMNRRWINQRRDLCLIREPPQAEETLALTDARRVHIIGDLPFDGRLIKHGDQDFELLKQRLRLCEESDGAGSDSSSEHESSAVGLDGFRLIDVEKQCIVRAELNNTRYVALSYVWGQTKQLLTLRNNVEELSQAMSLFAKEIIPHTIRDAMAFVTRLGMRYLWVDALCIIQDDEDGKMEQIKGMNQIYRAATLTLAITSAQNADSGIPGISVPRSPRQVVQEVNGIQMANKLRPLSDTIDEAKWNTRGWTYQERLLSQRTLFVSQEQTYFACCHGTFAEDEHCAHNATRLVKVSMIGEDFLSARSCAWKSQLETGKCSNVQAYAEAMHELSTRDFTVKGDTLNAFAGITSFLRPFFQGGFAFGLPETEFDVALLWQPIGDSIRLVDSISGKAQVPSWSWAGWSAAEGFLTPTSHRVFSRVKWVDAGGAYRDKWVFDSDDYRAGNYRPERWKNVVESSVPDGWAFDSETDAYFNEQNPKHKFHNPVTSEHLRSGRQRMCSPTGVLGLITLSAEFIVTKKRFENHKFGSLESSFCVFGHDTTVVGMVQIPNSILSDIDPGPFHFIVLSRTKRGQMNPSSRLDMSQDKVALLQWDNGKDDDTCDCKASRARERPGDEPCHVEERFRAPKGKMRILDKNPDGERFQKFKDAFDDILPADQTKYGFDRAVYDESKPWCMYNVMMVRFVDGIAYRLAVGQIHIDGFYHSRPRDSFLMLG